MKNLNNYQTYFWLDKIIETCNSLLHLETTEKLVENFKQRAQDGKLAEQIEGRFKVKAIKMNYYKWKHLRTPASFS